MKDRTEIQEIGSESKDYKYQEMGIRFFPEYRYKRKEFRYKKQFRHQLNLEQRQRHIGYLKSLKNK